MMYLSVLTCAPGMAILSARNVTLASMNARLVDVQWRLQGSDASMLSRGEIKCCDANRIQQAFELGNIYLPVQLKLVIFNKVHHSIGSITDN